MSATRHPRCRQSRLAPALVLLASGLALLAIIPLVAAQSGGGGGTAQTCYWPDGTVSGYKPCSSKGGACCYNLDVEHRDTCYSNGMCGSLYFGYYYRGACTDRNWGASCPNVCKSVTNYSVPLRFCKHMDAWCCQPEASRDDCCAQGVGIQWLNATQVNYHTQPLAAVDFEYDLAGAYTTTTDAGASAAALATAATRSSSLPSTAATNGAAQNSSGSDNSGANNGTSSNGGEKCANNDGKVIAVGAGLGVPLLAALAGLVWLAAKQRKYKRIGTPSPVVMPQEMPGHYTGGGGGGNGRGYADSPQYTAAELSGSGMKPELAGHSVEVPGPDAQRHYR